METGSLSEMYEMGSATHFRETGEVSDLARKLEPAGTQARPHHPIKE